MADSSEQLPWTDDQWNRVRQVVYEEARAARVAGNFLPLYGPLEPDAVYVSNEVLNDPGSPVENVPGFTVDDTTTLKLSTLQVKVYLRNAQVDDPGLTSALIAFRRGARVLAHLEDEIVFRGQAGPDQPTGAGLWEVRGGEKTPGMLGTFGGGAPRSLNTSPPSVLGEKLVSDVSRAVARLERTFHMGPFACVLGDYYFQAVQTPNRSLVLPQDRILPLLGGGPLVRSSALDADTGLLIALGGAPINLVVATDISVEFLQVTPDAWFVFRVYEKIILRISQSDAIEVISVTLPRRRGKTK